LLLESEYLRFDRVLNKAKIARLLKAYLYSLKVRLVFCFTSQSDSVLTSPCTSLSKSASFVA
jgi:hypothetical protein